MNDEQAVRQTPPIWPQAKTGRCMHGGCVRTQACECEVTRCCPVGCGERAMDVAQRGARNLQRYKINGGSEFFSALKIAP